MEPTILMNVPTSSDAYKEEIFGPVVIVNTFKTEEQAIAEANGTEFGLFGEYAEVRLMRLLTNSSICIHSRFRKSYPCG